MYLTVESFCLFCFGFCMVMIALGHILSQMATPAPSPAPSPARTSADVAATIVARAHPFLTYDGLPLALGKVPEVIVTMTLREVLSKHSTFSLPEIGPFSAITAEMVGYWLIEREGFELSTPWSEVVEGINDPDIEDRVSAWLEGMGCE